ncbi:MAG: ABC transporter permease subunit [Thermoplasmata archaeon]|nr:ABC transporter permease subunit [Thermoplasmata archaeon]
MGPREHHAAASVPSSDRWRLRKLPWWLLGGFALVTWPIAVTASLPGVGGVSGYLPTAAVDLGLSFTRMVAAYALSLGFALVYGYFAATHKTGERVLLPVLDILQSVPILGFFPVVIVFCLGLFPSSIAWVGPNLASIILIFTSMSWNMAFGVYESLKSIPNDLREAGDSFGVRGTQRIRELLLPATVNRLVYNSVLSWTGGWFFLVAAELFSVGHNNVSLPGIGSYLGQAAIDGNVNALVAGLALLIGLIIALDVLVWRPLGRLAERYRYDQVPSGEGIIPAPRRFGAPLRRAAGIVVRGMRTGVVRVTTPLAGLANVGGGRRNFREHPWLKSASTYIALGALLVVCWLLLIAMGVKVFEVATGPVSSPVAGQIRTLPLAILISLGRVSLAYVLCLAITLPLALFLVGRPKAYRVGMPTIEVVASVPASAFFPVIVFALVPVIGIHPVAILMLMSGMIWYLFFNIISGLRQIPPDLEEAARSYGLTKRLYYRRLVIPALIPSLITGSITAFGGGWNTLILAEYLLGGQFSVLGVGELLNKGLTETDGYPLFVAALLGLVIAVVTLNELLWKPLYRRAVERYRYD